MYVTIEDDLVNRLDGAEIRLLLFLKRLGLRDRSPIQVSTRELGKMMNISFTSAAHNLRSLINKQVIEKIEPEYNNIPPSYRLV